MNMLHTHNTLSNHTQKTRYRYRRITVPARIRERWCKIRPNGFDFHITKALSKAKVSSEKFKMYWRRVQPTIPQEDLFRLFEKAFGPGRNVFSKVDFINDILRRYQNMGEPVRDCVVCLSFLSMCCVGVLLYRCVIFVYLLHLLTTRHLIQQYSGDKI